jgi:FkbM family methyltransferase
MMAVAVRSCYNYVMSITRQTRQLLRAAAERVGIQVREPQYHGNSLNFDLRKSSVPPPAVIFDVGAHRGESLYIFNHWFPRSHVHCFEPGGEAFAALCKHARNNPRATCVNAALSDNVGEGTLYVRRGTANSSLLNYTTEHRAEDLRHEEAVRIDTIDNYCAANGIERIDMLKVDTEGLDLSVLTGGRAMFERVAIGIVQVEAGMEQKNTKHVPFQAFLDFFEKYEYSLFGVYDQALDWTTGRLALRRCNLVFMSPDIVSSPSARLTVAIP